MGLLTLYGIYTGPLKNGDKTQIKKIKNHSLNKNKNIMPKDFSVEYFLNNSKNFPWFVYDKMIKENDAFKALINGIKTINDADKKQLEYKIISLVPKCTKTEALYVSAREKLYSLGFDIGYENSHNSDNFLWYVRPHDVPKNEYLFDTLRTPISINGITISLLDANCEKNPYKLRLQTLKSEFPNIEEKLEILQTKCAKLEKHKLLLKIIKKRRSCLENAKKEKEDAIKIIDMLNKFKEQADMFEKYKDTIKEFLFELNKMKELSCKVKKLRILQSVLSQQGCVLGSEEYFEKIVKKSYKNLTDAQKELINKSIFYFANKITSLTNEEIKEICNKTYDNVVANTIIEKQIVLQIIEETKELALALLQDKKNESDFKK